jgi:pimeloyl-ACP methyl ester carboxylesterase
MLICQYERNMNRILAGFFLLPMVMTVVFGQSKEVSYGANQAVGKYYAVRGIKIYTEVYGQGKPLLLIHGNGGSIKDFSSTIPFFSKKYQVIAVDSRAQGKTIDRGDSLSFEMMADDFAELLNQMHIDSTFVIGWSDGGINAILLALRHPEKVIKMVSTGANMTPDSSAIIPSSWIDEQKQYERDKNKTWTTEKEKKDWKLFMLDWLQPNVPLTDLRAIRCPSLIICGDHDVITIAHTLGIYANIPSAYMWVIPNSGHSTLVEHRDLFNTVVDKFLKDPYQNRN